MVLDQAFQVLLQALVAAIATIGAVLIANAARLAAAYLQVKIGDAKFALLKGYAETIVRALEQNGAFEFLEGAEKKQRAIVAIMQFAEAHNIPIDAELVDQMIEEAVQLMNSELTKFYDELPAPLEEGEAPGIQAPLGAAG